MSEYSIPISRETSPARGKRKKLSTACDACQKRKSRCEMVTSKGCHRCRTLGTICSRAGGEEARRDPHADGFTGRSRSPSAVQASSSALEDLQTRTRRMEGMLSVLLRQSGAAHAPASHTILPGRTVLSSEEVVGPNNQSSVGLANRALNLRRMSYMRDPIALGLISDERWQMVYSDFSACIRGILPLDSLLGAWSNTDPFLRTCILVYQANHNSIPQSMYEKLLATLRANLDRLPLIRPTRPVILALLVLSLAPPYAGDGRSYTTADRFGAASRASDLARSIGLDRAVDRVIREDPGDWGKEWMKADVDDMKLWYCISHRARLVDLLDSSSLLQCSPPPTPFPTPRSFLDPLMTHLVLENQLLGLIDFVLRPFHTMYTARMYDPVLADSLEQGIQDYLAMSKNWRDEASTSSRTAPSRSYLILTQHLFDILLFLRITDWTNLPTPLGLDVISRFARAYMNRIHISATSALYLILSFLDHPDSSDRINLLDVLPGFTFTLVILAYKVVSQSHKLNESSPSHTSQLQTNSSIQPELNSSGQLPITVIQLDAIKAALIAFHPQYAPLLASIDGEEPPREWGGAMRELLSAENGDVEVGRWDWEGMFDFELYFGEGMSGAGWDLTGGAGGSGDDMWGGNG